METGQWSIGTTRASLASQQAAPVHETSIRAIPHDRAQPTTKPFPCLFPGCEKQFSRKEHLNRHTKIHEPLAQYRCHICGRRYARSDVLRRHVRAHSASDGLSRPEITLPSLKKMRDSHSTDATESAAPDVDTAWEDASHQCWDQIPEDSWLGLLDQEESLAHLPTHGESSIHTSLSTGEIAADLSTEASSISFILQWDSADGVSASQTAGLPLPATPNSSVQSRPSMEEVVVAYFAKVHPFWPILHGPTFSINYASDLLLASMALMVSWLGGTADHRHSFVEVFEAASSPALSNVSLQALQALFLCVAYATSHLSERNMTPWAIRMKSILVSACRLASIFSTGTSLHQQAVNDSNPLASWLVVEQHHRLAFSVLRIDTYLSLILDHPPSVRYEELCIPLPKSAALWEAATDSDRRRLQWSEPAGRDKSLFSSLMRDAIYGDRLPYGLTKDDCHMILLGLQSGVWEAAREAHSFASDVLDIKLTPGMPIETWRTRLEKWYRHTEQDCSIQKDYFLDAARRSTSDHDYLPPVTLLIRHMASIKMHAPLTILQLAVPSDLDVGACHIPSTTEEQHSRLKIWLESSCPRIAVYSASQIARVAMYELQDLPPAGIAGPLPLLNPLIVPGLLMSAMVVYSYVRCISACGACINLDTDRQEGLASSSHHSRPGYANLNLHEMDDLDDQALIEWKNSGHGLATIGHELIPLCKCKKPEVKTYFRRLLAVDRKAETGFLAFTRETSD